MLYVLLTLASSLPKRGDRGATTLEYGLIAGLIALTLVFGVDALKLALNMFWSGIQGNVDNWD